MQNEVHLPRFQSSTLLRTNVSDSRRVAFVDLSYRFDRNVLDRAAVTAIPTELAVLMVGVAVRQAASPTAQLQSDLDYSRPASGLFAPVHGAFNAEVERALNGAAASADPALTSRKEP